MRFHSRKISVSLLRGGIHDGTRTNADMVPALTLRAPHVATALTANMILPQTYEAASYFQQNFLSSWGSYDDSTGSGSMGLLAISTGWAVSLTGQKGCRC